MPARTFFCSWLPAPITCWPAPQGGCSMSTVIARLCSCGQQSDHTSFSNRLSTTLAFLVSYTFYKWYICGSFFCCCHICSISIVQRSAMLLIFLGIRKHQGACNVLPRGGMSLLRSCSYDTNITSTTGDWSQYQRLNGPRAQAAHSESDTIPTSARLLPLPIVPTR